MSQTVQLFSGPYDRPSHLLLFAGGAGLLLGVASLWLSPLLVLGGVVAVFLALAMLKRPEIALLGILIATSSILSEDRLPLISIGIGSLHMPDILLVASLGLIVLRWLVEPDFKIIRTPLDWPLLAFYGMTLLSTSLGVLRSSVEIRAAIRAIRIVTYYLTFFTVTNLVREDCQLRLLLRGLLLLATIVAAAMVAQFVLGESVPVLPGRVETLLTQGRSYEGITRVLPPGLSLVLVTLVVITVTLVLDRFRLVNVMRFFQWGLLWLAVVLTFLRSYWMVLGIVLFLLAYVLRGQDRQRLIVGGLLVMSLAAIVLLPILYEPESQAAKLVSASLARLGTLGSSATLGESSLQFRYVENEYALRQVAAHALTGLGLGARYRPWDPRLDWKNLDGTGFDGRAFLHNGHLWVMMKSGLLGYLCLMWLSLAFLIRGFRYWRLIPEPQMRGGVLGFTLAYLGVLVAAVVNSTFVEWYWTSLLGIMMGTNEVALRSAIHQD